MARTLAIGDIHGCFKTLKTLLEEKIAIQKSDTLIFLGDYIDRGPDTKSVIDYLMALDAEGFTCIFLRGNHEQTLIDALENQLTLKKGWFSKPKNKIFEAWFEGLGGRETLQSYSLLELTGFPESHLEWLKSSVFYHKNEHFYFVHAGFNFTENDILSDPKAMLWTREFEYDAHKAGNRKIVHGHVPVKLDFLKECLSLPKIGFIPLDTGCVYKDRPGMGYLSAYDFSTETLYSLKNCE